MPLINNRNQKPAGNLDLGNYIAANLEGRRVTEGANLVLGDYITATAIPEGGHVGDGAGRSFKIRNLVLGDMIEPANPAEEEPAARPGRNYDIENVILGNLNLVAIPAEEEPAPLPRRKCPSKVGKGLSKVVEEHPRVRNIQCPYPPSCFSEFSCKPGGGRTSIPCRGGSTCLRWAWA